MFEVHAESPIDDEWEDREGEIVLAAGRKSDRSSAGKDGKNKVGVRRHCWLVASFRDAQRMRKALEKVPKVRATLKEA